MQPTVHSLLRFDAGKIAVAVVDRFKFATVDRD